MIYLCIGCSGYSWLCSGFLQLQGAASRDFLVPRTSCGVWASHWWDRCFRAQACGVQ